jgi:exonuclease III
VRIHESDILFLQEIVANRMGPIHGYNTDYNIGRDLRGTALIVKERIHLTSIEKLPTGRAIATQYHQMLLSNIYVPSGSNARREREYFLNTEIIYLLRHAPTYVILGGYFDCVLDPLDCTGEIRLCTSLTAFIKNTISRKRGRLKHIDIVSLT